MIKTVVGDSFRFYGLLVTLYAAGMSKGLYYTDDNDTQFWWHVLLPRTPINYLFNL